MPVFLIRAKTSFDSLREIFILKILDVGISDFRQPSLSGQLSNNSRNTRHTVSTLTRCESTRPLFRKLTLAADFQRFPPMLLYGLF